MRLASKQPEPTTSAVPVLRLEPWSQALQAMQRRPQALALALLALPITFVVAAFLLPVALFLVRSVDGQVVPQTLPLTVDVLASWDGASAPDDSLFEALAADLRAGHSARTLAALAAHLEHQSPGFRALLMGSGSALSAGTENPRDLLIKQNAQWAELWPWQVLARESSGITPHFLLATADLTRTTNGSIVSVAPSQELFVDVFIRTLWMTAVVTFFTLILSFPVAHLLAHIDKRTANILLILVLLPFWTSLLVRTAAWQILLEDHGVINSVALLAGVTKEPIRLIYNRFGVYIAMVYVFLPFMILPLYATMRTVRPDTMRAAATLGANYSQAFRLVYLPQVMPGVAAGCMTVAVLSVGYYITPLLIGSPRDQMLSYFIAFFVNGSLNWGMAAALAVVLVVLVTICLALTSRVFGLRFDRFR